MQLYVAKISGVALGWRLKLLESGFSEKEEENSQQTFAILSIYVYTRRQLNLEK